MTEKGAILNLDFDDLTVNEIDELETRLGKPIDEIGVMLSNGSPKAPILRAFAYVFGRRDNPDLTWEEAGNLRITLNAAPVDPPAAADS